MPRANSTSKAIEQLEKVSQLTPAGKRWLITATDPFHDIEIPATGFPDVTDIPTVVQVVRETKSISLPAAMTQTNWDCNFVMSPYYTKDYNAAGVEINDGQILPGGSATSIYSGLICSIATSGANTWPPQDVVPTKHQWVQLLPPPIDDGSRIVAMAFEVTNTTAPINQQGSVCCYRQAVNMSSAEFLAPFNKNLGPLLTPPTAGFLTSLATCATCVGPPGQVDGAMLLSGSVQWHAKDGSYVVSRLYSDDLPLQSKTELAAPIVYTGATGGIEGYAAAIAIAGGNVSTAYNVADTPTCGKFVTKSSPYDWAGAYYTGLSVATTLQVTVKWYIEIAPAFDQTLVTLAQPSPEYDPLAVELYMRAMRALPSGVPVGENPAGEFFQRVLQLIRGAALPIGAMLAPLTGGASLPISMAVRAAASGASKALTGSDPAPTKTSRSRRKRKPQATAQRRALT